MCPLHITNTSIIQAPTGPSEQTAQTLQYALPDMHIIQTLVQLLVFTLQLLLVILIIDLGVQTRGPSMMA